jgi:hypothetical protein
MPHGGPTLLFFLFICQAKVAFEPTLSPARESIASLELLGRGAAVDRDHFSRRIGTCLRSKVEDERDNVG